MSNGPSTVGHQRSISAAHHASILDTQDCGQISQATVHFLTGHWQVGRASYESQHKRTARYRRVDEITVVSYYIGGKPRKQQTFLRPSILTPQLTDILIRSATPCSSHVLSRAFTTGRTQDDTSPGPLDKIATSKPFATSMQFTSPLLTASNDVFLVERGVEGLRTALDLNKRSPERLNRRCG